MTDIKHFCAHGYTVAPDSNGCHLGCTESLVAALSAECARLREALVSIAERAEFYANHPDSRPLPGIALDARAALGKVS